MSGQAQINSWLVKLKHLRYQEILPLTTWYIALEGQEQSPQTVTLPVTWGGYDQTVWWYKKVTLPASWVHQKIALHMDIAEGLVFINQQVYQGIDTNHPEIILPSHLGLEMNIAIQAYSGRQPELPQCQFSELVWINQEAERLYTCLEQLVAIQDEYPGVAASLAHLATQEWGEPGGNLSELTAQLTQALSAYWEAPTTPTIHLVGHSHIDVVWLWTLKETRRKLARTFTTALNLIQEFPHFCFLQGQAQLYVYLQQDYPEIYQRVKKQVQAGRWQIEGTVWVEPDGNLINGESWVRQLVYGQRFWQQEFQQICQVLWLPDTFGCHGNLPQLLQQVGVSYFFTTKLNWNDTAAFPLDSFWWQGIDGTRVLAHQPPVGLEGLMSIKDLEKTGQQYQQKSVAPVVLQTFGYGDGGGGVTRQHLQLYELTQPHHLPFPHQISNPRHFFETLATYGEKLPVWVGELYLQKHRGTYTTHSRVKQLHRQAERELFLAELIATLAWMQGHPYPQALLEQTWKLLLLQQFHDILPGTFIQAAYPDILDDFNQIFADLWVIRRQGWECLSHLALPPYTWTIFNPIHAQPDGYVIIPIQQPELAALTSKIIFRVHGQVVPHQWLDQSCPIASLYPEHTLSAHKVLCRIPSLDAHCFTEIKLEILDDLDANAEPFYSQANQFTVQQSSQGFYELTNVNFQLVFDTQGDLVTLWDKRLQKNILLPGHKGGELQLFLDRPRQWEAWDIDADYCTHPRPPIVCIGQPAIERGILRSGLAFTYQVQNEMGLDCQIKKSIYLYHDAPWIEFFVDVDLTNNRYAPWLLKILFPFDLHCAQATFDIPFGMMQRSTTDPAQFEVPALSWADLSTAAWGVSLLSRDKYGWNATPNTLGLTLLRVAHYPHPVEPWHRTDTDVTDTGTHQFCFRLYPHAGSIATAQTTHKALEFLYPPLVYPGTWQQPIATPILIFDAPNLVIACIKKAMDRDGIIIRIYEAYGQAVQAQMQPQFPVREIWECDLLEQPCHCLSNPALFSLTFTPFMVKTLCLIPDQRLGPQG